MPIDPNARKVLTEENNLLADLAKAASTRGPAGAWGQFFERWRKNNDRLIALSADSAVEAELNEEVARLNGMLNTLGDTPGATFWKDSLNEDIKNTQELLKKP